MILLAKLAPVCHKRILKASKYGEHMGFIGLAGAEVFHAVAALWYVNVCLLVTGVGAFPVREDKRRVTKF